MTALMLAAMLSLGAEAPKEKHKVTEIKFDEVEGIDGERLSPDILDVSTYKPARFGTLIKVRENFDDKIVKSVDQL